MPSTSATNTEFDAIVVGAGFSGLYALQQLREAGLNVLGLEKGTGVGGTWYWNRYPGARTDSTTEVYQYWFSEELLKEWKWSERFAAQEETERYLNFVADKFDLRGQFRFGVEVSSAIYDEASDLWSITTADGDALSARFLLMCTGGLSEPIFPKIEGRESFAGEMFHTSRWPHEPIDYTGKRVGVFGTGATGIQVIQSIADKVGHLKVFQRTPNYTIPMRNPKLDAAAHEDRAARFPEIQQRVRETFTGFEFDFDARPFHEVSPEERRQKLEDLYADGSLAFWVGSFFEVFVDEGASQEFSDFAREKMRARLKDPKVAEKLMPKDYLFGTRRVPLETGYYEAYNRDNVELIDLRETPVERITPDGVVTSAEAHDLDMLIFATGFDAGRGAINKVDVRGRNGTKLKDIWDKELRSFMGLQVHGFPNLFMTMGPLSPAAALCNAPTCIQQQVEWIRDAIDHVRGKQARSMEPKAEAEAEWLAHHYEVSSQLLALQAESWYVGSNVDGKPKGLIAYAGGSPAYIERCEAVKAGGYSEFNIA